MSKIDMKRLTIDIETSPNIAYVWGLKNQFISLNQVIEQSRMLSFAAKWYHEEETMFFSEYHDGAKTMVKAAYDLLNEADVLIHFNGKSFDYKHLNREFLLAGFPASAPVQHIDLLRVVQRNFWLTSNKLDNVLTVLGLENKVGHTGFQLWADCLNNDPTAWELMKKYNIGDVTKTEQVYDRLLPWIHDHPNMALFTGGKIVCRCGSDNIQRRGFYYTPQSKVQRYRCNDCGAWFKDNKAIIRTPERGIR